MYDIMKVKKGRAVNYEKIHALVHIDLHYIFDFLQSENC